jgi:hypothetical protein
VNLLGKLMQAARFCLALFRLSSLFFCSNYGTTAPNTAMSATDLLIFRHDLVPDTLARVQAARPMNIRPALACRQCNSNHLTIMRLRSPCLFPEPLRRSEPSVRRVDENNIAMG